MVLSKRTNNALVQTFTANTKNELTGIASAGTVTVAGATTIASSVSVNGSTTGVTRYADNTFAGTGQAIASTYTANATATYLSAQSIITPNLSASVSPTYDANGNLASDGQRTFDYDDENRLIRVTASNAWKTEFVHDGLGREGVGS
jgi:hypothetical protein